MKRYVVFFLAAFLIIGLGQTAAMGDGNEGLLGVYGTWYIGGGLSFISIISDEKIYTNGTEQGGFHIVGGYQFNDLLALEAIFAGSTDSNMIAEIYGVGPRFYLSNLRKDLIVPWLAAYLTWVSLEWEEENVSMSSLSFCGSGGVDLRIGGNSFIEMALRYYSFTDDLERGSIGIDEDVGTEVLEIAVSYLIHFW